jgi:phage tail-like protein
MARSAVSDPLRNFKFKVQISPSGSLAKATGNGIKNLGFSVVSGISVTNETIAYREGGMNTHPHKMIGQSDFTPVTFSKGVFANESALYNWQTFLHSWTQGSNFNNGSSSGGGRNDYRCDITVTVYDHPVSNGKYALPGGSNAGATPAGAPKLGFKLFNCWPSSWSMTDLNAGDSSILIQQLVVVHEGFQVLWAPSAAGQINTSTLASLS